jgi:hypothetical protein
MPAELTAAHRARWLAELADALEQAQKLSWRIGSSDAGNAEAMELYARLEAARVEVQSLRLGGFKVAGPQEEPDWTELLMRLRDDGS